jgi:hypothetical protein
MGLILWRSHSSWCQDCRVWRRLRPHDWVLRELWGQQLLLIIVLEHSHFNIICSPNSMRSWWASYHLVCPLVYSTWTWTRDVHSTLCNINLLNVTSSLISRNLRERMFSVQISLLIVIIIIIAIVARLTLWYFIVSHATLILNYHASMFTLQNSLISRAFWLSQAWQYGV